MRNKINPNLLEVVQLDQEHHDSAISFLEHVFNVEQHIPKALIPLQEKSQKWWCIRDDNEVIAIVAAWKIESEWHWGRLAIHKELRGLGLGKKIAMRSFHDLFQMGIEEVTIDARDITVDLLLKMGGRITGEKTLFYGEPITPMKIHKNDFIK